MSIDAKDPTVILCGHSPNVVTELEDALAYLNVDFIVLEHTPEEAPHSISAPFVLIIDTQEDFYPWMQMYRRGHNIVVAVVDENDEAAYALAVDKNADYILEKPFQPAILKHRLRHIIRRWQHVYRTRDMSEKIRLSTARRGYALYQARNSNPSPHIRWISGASLLNGNQDLTPEEILEVSGAYNLVHEEDRDFVRAADTRCLKGEAQHYQFRMVDANGKIINIYKQCTIDATREGYFIYVLLERIKDEPQNPQTIRHTADEHDDIVEIIHSTAITLSSTLDFSTVLDRMLDTAAHVIPFEFADVMMVEDGLARVVRHRGYEQFGLEEAIHNVTLSLKDNAILREMAGSGQPERIADVTQDPRFQLPEEIGIVRSYLGIPMYVGERLAGFLHFNHTMPGFFTKMHQDYAAIISGQISVAISNAQLYEIVTRHSVELEQRIRDLIIIHDIGKSLQATLDVREIYRMTYKDVICRILDGARLDVLLFDSSTQEMNPVFAIDPNGEIDVSDGQPFELNMGMPSTREQQVLVSAMRTFEPRSHETVLYQPLVAQDHVVGMLKITHPSPIMLDEVELTLLSTVVGQAAIAIENARLYATVQDQIAELTSLYVATTALFNSEDIEVTAQQITDSIVEQFNQPNCGLCLLQEDERTIVEVAQSGTYLIENRKPLHINDNCAIAEAMRTGSVVYVADTRSEPPQPHRALSTRSEIVVPLNTQQGTIGVLDLQSPHLDDFDERDFRVLQAFAERAAAAIENRRLYDLMEQRVLERTAKLREALLREREVNNIQSRFVQNVSHQFRTPLTAILTAGQMLERYNERMTDSDRQIRYDTIRKAVAEMERLLDDSVSMSRATEGLLEFQPSAVDVGNITETIVSDFNLQERDITQRFVFGQRGDCSIAFVDVQLWHRIVKELLLNAAKYSHLNDEITCTIECDDNDITLEVIDHGVGIPASDLPHIFDMFHRGANVSNIYGSGLGLSIVHRAIELHGGKIKLESEVNKGTRVIVTLPRYSTKVKENDD